MPKMTKRRALDLPHRLLAPADARRDLGKRFAVPEPRNDYSPFLRRQRGNGAVQLGVQLCPCCYL